MLLLVFVLIIFEWIVIISFELRKSWLGPLLLLWASRSQYLSLFVFNVDFGVLILAFRFALFPLRLGVSTKLLIILRYLLVFKENLIILGFQRLLALSRLSHQRAERPVPHLQRYSKFFLLALEEFLNRSLGTWVPAISQFQFVEEQLKVLRVGAERGDQAGILLSLLL